MAGIDWGSLNTGGSANALGSVAQGFQAGRAFRQMRDVDRAVRAYDPADPQSLQRLAVVDPDRAKVLAGLQRDADTREALAGLYPPRASAGAPMPDALTGAVAASPAIAGAQPNALGAPGVGQVAPQPDALALPAANGPANLLPAALAEPASPPSRGGMREMNPEAMTRLWAVNPELAGRLQESHDKRRSAQLKFASDHFAFIGNLASLAQDQESYGALRSYAADMGEDVSMLPEVYDPDRMDVLADAALTGKQRADAQLARDRFDWDVEDDEIDNARSDRGLDNTIADRAARRGLVARGQDMTDARGRYGIGVASADRRRGQDISSADRQRGQSARGGRGSGTGAAAPVSVSTLADAMKLPSGTRFRTPDGRVKVRP